MNLKKVFAVLLVVMLAMTCVFAQSIKEVTHGEYYGKTVILHSNDVHGAIEGYAKMAALKADYEAKDATVILVDNGDYSQGTPYVSHSKGLNAVEMMNATGYNVAGLGNHEFDFGYAQLVENMKQADFAVLCSDIFTADGKSIFDDYYIFTTPKGTKIGFFGIDTPTTRTKVNPVLIQELEFVEEEELYAVAQAVIDELKAQGVDTIICIAHLGIDSESGPDTSFTLMDRTAGIDFVIDGHSHSVFTGFDGKAIQQTGTKFANIGVIVLDDITGAIEDYYLVDCAEIEDDPEIAAIAKAKMDEVDAVYGFKFAESLVELNGDKAPGNRNMETNNGDLITDSMLWAVVADPSALSVPVENVVCITNGGGIRAWIHAGDVTMNDVTTVLPFGNTVTVVYVSGAELLEALEASSFCTPSAVGGFPQIAGMKITIDTTTAYNPNAETYPGSTYYGPATIERVTIDEVNGNAFDPAATYAVVTNNFCSAGGDTYYAFASAAEQFDTSLPMDEVLMEYITEVLGGVIGEQYAEPQGRITIIQ